MLYYTTPGAIPQVVFSGKLEEKKIFVSRQIPANFTPLIRYTMRQRATPNVPILQHLLSFAGRGLALSLHKVHLLNGGTIYPYEGAIKSWIIKKSMQAL